MLIITSLDSQARNKSLTKAIILFMVIGAIWSAWPSFEGRVISPIINYFSGGPSVTTVTQRVDEMAVILPMTLDNFFIGTGIGNYSRAIYRYRVIYNAPDLPLVPHNIFLYFFGMVGIVGAIGFLWLLIMVIRAILLARSLMISLLPGLASYVYIGAVGSLVGYIPVIITHNGFFGNEMWLSMAFMLIAIKLQTEDPKNLDKNKSTRNSTLLNSRKRRHRLSGL